VLVVVTKVRKYIADKSGMNTSAGVYEELTEKIKRLCDLAIEEARVQGRKTVMDRDFH
jgi:histone H3/H4